MPQHEISMEDIEALLEFLPLFETPGRRFAKWGDVERNADGSISMPFPIYDEDVEEFFRRIGQHGWIDCDYKPDEAARMIEDADFIERASLEQIRTMLTLCVRGERFCDGHRESLLAGGQIIALLRRLKTIREQM